MRPRALLTWMVSVFALAVSACVQPGAVTCADGRTCPAAFVCDEVRHACALPEQMTACDGKNELDACSFAGTDGGVCSAGVCMPAGCGNGIVELDEACDDGNVVHGDGCSADCLSSELCGNGIIDETTGEGCDDGNTLDADGCQHDCKPARCGDGIVDILFNEECDDGALNSQEPDASCRANCLLRRCGDFVTDSNESCDDGNQQSSDGCRFDCLSDETCGNDRIDHAEGELCDDGDSLSHDGCGVCQPEAARWTQQLPAPSARMRHAMAYDAARGRIVMFGGQDASGMLGDTWEWSGTGWTKLTPLTGSPPARRGHAMAYDAKRDMVVLFGGYGSDQTLLADTWQWNGAAWTEMTPATARPPAREQHALAYDASRGQIVLFGGNKSSNGTALADDTWVWTGSAWADVTPSAVSDRPSARRQMAMAFDAARGGIVLFGGNTGGFNRVADTWEWNGTAWIDTTPGAPAAAPQAREDHALAFDAAAGRVVMVGGFNAGYLADAWEWNGTEWISVGGLGGRYAHALAFHIGRRALLVFGGNNGSYSSETWERDGDSWTQRIPATPPGRLDHAIAYDAARAQIVVFGGDGSSGRLGDIWEWSNRTWTERTPTSASPTPREAHALAYDPIRGRVLLFGGLDNTGTFKNDTWEWDGEAWTDVTPASGNPPARYHHALAYDAAHGRIVLFGGFDGATKFADTWAWNGSAWTNVSPASGPAGRYGHALAYDVKRARVVMFGGWQGTVPTLYGDTWEWDGTSWANGTPAVTPSPHARRYHALAYDSNRARVVLFGGWRSAAYANDTWDWDGTTWTNLSLVDRPAVRYGHALVFDPVAGELAAFGGSGGFAPLDETWRLRHDNASPDESCRFGFDGDGDGKVGCADDDCYASCSPGCNPALTSCAAATPRCGDGVCQALEDARLCATDCGPPTPLCGDFLCESPETSTTCPGDCSP